MENKKTYELNEEEINKLRQEVEKYTTEADLVRSRFRTQGRCFASGAYVLQANGPHELRANVSLPPFSRCSAVWWPRTLSG